MKHFIRCLATLLILFKHLPAMAQKKLSYEIKVGEAISDVITSEEAYQYKVFKPAILVLTTGQTGSSKVNYHALFGEMHYIASNGDTLAISNESPVKYLAVDQDTFYYNDGFMRLVASTKGIKILKKEKIVLAEKLKSTGYNSTSSAAIESLYGVANAKLFKTLIANEKMIFARESTFYFQDKNDQPLPATKTNLLKMYQQNRKAVEQYLAANPVNFTKEDELKRLAMFLNGF